MSYSKSGKLNVAAAQAGMDPKTARKYLRNDTLPSEPRPDRHWRTREDIFAEDWPEIEQLLADEGGLQAKTVFEWLQRRFPGKYQDGQLRTLQRRMRHWRATAGPAKEVMFPQIHSPGRLCASDFTCMNGLRVTIGGQEFTHKVFHFVLTYSNWETATLCFSESFESLSDGLQDALWELGGLPAAHRTDQLSSAVHKELGGKRSFTSRYAALMEHYGLRPERIQVRQPHENGDAEKSHDLFKNAVDQELMLRGSRDFSSREEYTTFLGMLLARRNAGRRERFTEEQAALRPLPARRLASSTALRVRVRTSSTITVLRNVYSVPSRLIGETVVVRLGTESLSVFYDGKRVEADIPRMRGAGGHRINYRHVIDSLVRKPGAFAAYQWQEDLFPTSRFRIAYDLLQASHGASATKEYLRILELAAKENETAVDEALRTLLDTEQTIGSQEVETVVKATRTPQKPRDVCVAPVDLSNYDRLIGAHRRIGNAA
jgi:hypothetical protein